MPLDTTQVVLYTDQPFLAKALASTFDQTSPFRLAGFANSVTAVREFLEHRNPAVALIDLTPEISLPALRTLRQIAPKCNIALWVYSISEELAFQAMQLGVRGIIRKTASIERFLSALEAVADGKMWFEQELLETLINGRRVVLTRREGQLVALLAHGLRNKQIATNLQIREGTVKVYLSRLFKKLGVSDRLEVALLGLRSLSGDCSLAPDAACWLSSLHGADAGLLALQSILVGEREGHAPPEDAECALHGLVRD
jgi:two-component system, NarL family, nitrate/nitrite response regulator NarL